jgi:succinoglycan biosynthesis transport protein ExoP
MRLSRQYLDNLPVLRTEDAALSPGQTITFPPRPVPEGSSYFFQLVAARKWAIIACMLAGTGIAVAYASYRTPVYRAHSAIEVQRLNDNVLNSRDLDPSLGMDTSPQSYLLTQVRVLQSTPLLTRVLQKVNPADSDNEAGKRGLTVGSLAAGLKVTGTEASQVLDITYDSTDPRLAAEVLNVLGSEFIEQDIEEKIERRNRTSKWLNQQIDELRQKLKTSEAALQDYARRSHMVLAADQSNAADARLRLLENDLEKAEAERIEKQAAYENVNGDDNTLATATDPAEQEYQMKLTELRRSLAELLAVYKPDYYKVKRVQAQIKETESAEAKHSESALQRMKKEYDSGRRREELLEKAYSQQTKVVTDQGAKAVDYEVLKREVETNRQVYEAMFQKVKSYHIASAMLSSSGRVIEPADIPLHPALPNRPMDIALGGISGLFGGLMLAILKRRTPAIRVPGDTRHFLHTQELGVIPSVRKKGFMKSSGEFVVEKMLLHEEPPAVAESFRATRASLIFASESTGSSVFSVSSVESGEGKTTVVSNLGISLAEVGKSVVLIDADQGRPKLHSIFDVPNRFGLADLLRDKREIKDIPSSGFIGATQVPGLCVLPSGNRMVGASSLLYSARMASLLVRLRREFDMVLVDTPPLTLLSDARVLGRLTNGVILVFRAGKARLESAQAVHQQLSEDNIPIIGTILNDWRPAKGSGLYSYQQGEYEGRTSRA